MSDPKNILDLDELFGQARAVKVKWQDKEYELLRMDAISPKQAVKFQQLELRAGNLQSIGAELTDENAAELEQTIDEMLAMLCKDLPLAELSFIYKTRILTFYAQETQGKKALKVALKNLTGATPSRK